MSERRYDEDEIREIFDAASTPLDRRRTEAHSEGLSLEDLKRIAGEVGLSPTRIEEAARALDDAPSGPRVERDFGLPVGVGRTVALPREPTDREWERIVSLCRRTFGAKGNADSADRYWWNGNLSVSVEPSAGGYRLRLDTTKGDARAWNRIGAGAVAVALLGWVSSAIGFNLDIVSVNALAFGVVSLAINAFRLPSWSRRRLEQMELVARRTVDLLLESDRPD